MNCKQDELNETPTETRYKQTFKRQRILKAREDLLVTDKGSLVRIRTDFSSRTLGAIVQLASVFNSQPVKESYVWHNCHFKGIFVFYALFSLNKLNF